MPEPDDKQSDVVCLTLYQKGSSTKIVRLATAGVASKFGFNLDEADDIQTALEELLRFHKSDAGHLCIRYNIFPDRLVIVTRGISRNLLDGANKIDRYSRFILEKVADSVDEAPSPDGGFEVTIVKNLPPQG